MTTQINLPAVLIANIMGICILFAVAVGNFWRFKNPSKKTAFFQ